MHSRFADLLVRQGLRLVGFEAGKRLSYVGLCTGAFDAFFTALRRTDHEAWYAAGAEVDPLRAQVVVEAFQVPAERMVGDMADLADSITFDVDVVSMTHPCGATSTTPAMTPGVYDARKTEAVGVVSAAAHALIHVIHAARPKLVLVEQPVMQKTHFSEAYRCFNALLLGLHDYKWYHGTIDATRLGASHARNRMGWIGVRL